MKIISRIKRRIIPIIKYEGLSEITRKMRSQIIFISVTLIIIPPQTTVTISSVPFTGQGISIAPQLYLPIGTSLMIFLLYKVISFVVTVYVGIGTTNSIVQSHVASRIDPDIPNPDSYDTPEDFIFYETGAIQDSWHKVKAYWEIVAPVFLALIAAFFYFFRSIF